MRAEELMLGDLVRYKENMYKVYDLRTKRSDMHQIGLYDSTYGGVYPKEDEIEPIKLTPEILSKNGFEKRLIDDEYCYSLVTMDYAIVKRTNRDGYWKYDSVRGIGKGVVFQGILDYVHELQHALRLCGLTELANNFRVE